ncbi:hypothetical protein [Streptomyces sp. NRRL B-24484]|uniref:hypothetical protein n=1 Tax=Streptomyces sp. NRRL B-24484 TaxID=1463833 RepID=UPI0005B87F77|nr:hypothetical protein [Streptomyces sp. NRRL B-24484]
MSLIIIASAKGAPGSSTTALAMAGEWPRQSLLAELDPLGSDLVYRQVAPDGNVLDPNRGMFSLALPARGVLSPDVVREHLQELPGGQQILLGLSRPEQGAAWGAHWDKLGRVLAAPGATDVIADIGRFFPGAPVSALLPHASLVLLVSRTTAEDLAHVRARAAAVQQQISATGRRSAPIGVLLVAPLRKKSQAVEAATRVLAAGGSPAQVVGVVAYDPDAAEQLAGRRRGRIHKTQLVASVRGIVADLENRFGLAAQPAPARTDLEGVRR